MTMHVKFTILTLGAGLGILAGVIMFTSPAEPGAGSHSPRKFNLEISKRGEFKYPGSTIQAWQEWGDSLVILDQASQEWLILDQQGKPLGKFGEAGPAPWQNQEVKNFTLRGDSMYSVDTRSMMVRLHHMKGADVSHKKLQEVVWDGIHLEGSRFLLLNDESEEFGFFVFDMKTGTRGPVQVIADSLSRTINKNQNIVFEGEFVQGKDKSYYICSRGGFFIVIDRLGNITSVRTTIDKSPLPEIIERKAGNLVVFEREPDAIVNYSATADRQHLYILSQIAFRESEHLRLDVYASDGTYIHSAELPNRGEDYPVKILKGKELLYVIYEDQYIVSYDLDEI